MDESRNTSVFYPDPAEIHIADDIEQQRTTTDSQMTPYNLSMEQMEVQVVDDEVQEVNESQIIGIISNNKRGIIACVICTILLFIVGGISIGINVHHLASNDNQQNMEPSKTTESPMRSLSPQTFRPATFEPDTLAPETLGPETLAPQTLKPETLSPDTSTPQTLKPETFAPDTLKPETLAPETFAPQTLKPQTYEPATFSPSDNPSKSPIKTSKPTDHPQTFKPATLEPATLEPATLEPETLKPETLSPDTSAPQTLKPETLAPETLKPETLAPETLAPQTYAPNARPLEWNGIDQYDKTLFAEAGKWYTCDDGYVFGGFYR